MMCVFLPLYLYAYQQARHKWEKWFFLACALAAVWIIFETGSRTGMVTLVFLGIFLLPHYARRRWKTLILTAVVVIMIYPFTGERNKARFRTIPQSAASFLGFGKKEDAYRPPTQDEQSAEERQAKNRDTWALIKEHLFFGVGVNPDASKYTDRFPMASGQVHCEILMAGRQMGIIGMGLYSGFIILIFIQGWRIRKQAVGWPALRDLGWTFQLQAVAFAVGGSFSPGPWNPVMMILAGLSSAMIRLVHEERVDLLASTTAA
jgi:O-antigen ligase